jgi:hypothetical protein
MADTPPTEAKLQRAATPGTFVTPTTVRLRSGHLITEVRCDAVDGWPYYTGWLAGGLYISTDGGQTWRPSDLVFRCY